MQSGPELLLPFNLLTIFTKVSDVTLEKIKFSITSGPKKLSNFILDGAISSASFGPIPAKKLLNPSAIFRGPVRGRPKKKFGQKSEMSD